MSDTAIRARSLGRPLLATGAVTALAIGLTALAVQNALAALAVGYVLAFWIVAWNWPHIALTLIFATTPFQNDLSGESGLARFSAAEINLMLAIPVFLAHLLLRRRIPSMGPMAIPILLYLAVCGYSSWVTWRPESAPLSIVQMVLFMFVAVMVFSSFAIRAEQLRLCFAGLVASTTIIGVAVLVSGSGYVLGLHKNGTGPSLALALIVAVEMWFAESNRSRRWLLGFAMAVIAPGLLVTLSRGAWLGAAVGFAVIVALRGRYAALARFVLVLAPLMAVAWNALPRESRDYATDLGPNRYNIQARYDNIAAARHFYEGSPVYGAGVGLRKEYDATSIYWFTLAETGYLGLTAFALVNLAFVSMVWKTQRRVSRDDALYSMLAVGAAFMLATLARGMVDHYWQRGPAFAAWAAAGMAVAVYARFRAPASDAGEDG
jgi:hypothetical protein